MKLEERNAWTTALRSGNYKQGVGRLCADNLYCCLGVYAASRGLSSEDLQHGNLDHLSNFKHELGFYKDESLQAQLVKLNDSDRKSFDEIADWIETNVPVDP